jgi:hypothetical protein
MTSRNQTTAGNLVPREHGAYGQVAFPLLTSLVVAGPAYASICLAIAVIALFLAHEPILVLLGRRGVSAHTAHAGSAWWWLTGTLIIATASALLALDATAPSLRWTFVVPVLPAAGVMYAVVRDREKTLLGETAAALAFATAALPMCAGAGRPATGAAIAFSFALLFVLSTLAVRVIILRTRGGGNPQAVRRTRVATVLSVGAGVLIVLVSAVDGIVTPGAVAAILPGSVFACVLAACPPPAARLKRVGWTLVAVSALTSVLLMVAG